MLLTIAHLIVAVLVLVILYFAYFRNNTLGKLSAFVILAAIVLVQVLNGLAGIIADVDFLNFLENLLKGISGIVIFAELVLLIILAFFGKHKSKEDLLKWSIVGYVVLVLLIEFNVLG